MGGREGTVVIAGKEGSWQILKTKKNNPCAGRSMPIAIDGLRLARAAISKVIASTADTAARKSDISKATPAFSRLQAKRQTCRRSEGARPVQRG